MKFYWSDREGNPPPADCTFHVRPFSSPLQSVPSPTFTKLPAPTSAKVLKRTYSPTKKGWIQNVEKALALIRDKKLEKVVLARLCTLELDRAPDPFAITAALKQKAEGAFVFCIQSEVQSFLGATPERLFSRKGQTVLSEAIAATCRRSQIPFEEKELQKELLTSAKALREFSPVQSYLQRTLSPFCESPLDLTPISVHQTQNVQHLYSRLSGKLKKPTPDEELLASLHPTPALCGVPQEEARRLIQELEPFERGLYGGAIGWSTPKASEWVVAIRCCLLQKKNALLFSGTGIVEGSDPEAEWEELNEKIKLYDGILDH